MTTCAVGSPENRSHGIFVAVRGPRSGVVGHSSDPDPPARASPGVDASSSAPSRTRQRRFKVDAASAATPARPAGTFTGAVIVVVLRAGRSAGNSTTLVVLHL